MTVPPEPAKKQEYTLAEVRKHSTPGDCWLIIRGKVYDVSKWAKNHPGGQMIFIRPGQDVTQMFESYHPLYVRGMLNKFHIGDVKAGPGEKQIVYAPETEFYKTLKERVESHFSRRKTSPRDASFMYLKTLSIVLLGLISYYGTFFAFSSIWPSLVSALFLGFAFTLVGVSIQHDGNHGAYSNKPWLCRATGAMLDLVGASSFMWRQQHDIGHHSYTNVEGADPDIRVKDPDVRRVTLTQPFQWYQKYQHIYLAVLYGLLALKSVLVDDFKALSDGFIGSVKFDPLDKTELTILLGGKAIFFTYMILIPSFFLPLWRIMLLFVAAEVVTGYCLSFMFQVAHVVEDVDWPVPDQNGVVAHDWATMQVATTTDFSPQSAFWTFVSGGLNYQIEHHLFPTISHVYYGEIAPIVEATCREYKVPYHCYPTFWQALASHFRWLKRVGASGAPVSFKDMRLGD